MTDNQSIANHVFVELRRIIRAIDIHSRKLIRDCDLTGPQLIILNAIHNYKEISMSKLAKNVSLSNATVSGIINRLEKRKLVKRIRNDDDRRLILVQNTPRAEILLKEAPPFLQEKLSAELSKLEKWEREQILASLSRIAFMMGAEELDAAPVLTSYPITISDNVMKDIVSNMNSSSTEINKKGK